MFFFFFFPSLLSIIVFPFGEKKEESKETDGWLCTILITTERRNKSEGQKCLYVFSSLPFR